MAYFLVGVVVGAVVASVVGVMAWCELRGEFDALVASRAPKDVRLSVTVKEGGRVAWRDLGALPAARALHGLALAWTLRNTGRAFSVRETMSGGLSRGEYETLRDELVARGFLRWSDDANRRAGVTWTRAGVALIEAARNEKLRCAVSVSETW